jgi:hypothetical protein
VYSSAVIQYLETMIVLAAALVFAWLKLSEHRMGALAARLSERLESARVSQDAQADCLGEGRANLLVAVRSTDLVHSIRYFVRLGRVATRLRTRLMF